MGKTLYLECGSGISGDMVVGALLDLGANEAGLRRALSSLRVDGFDIAVTRKSVSGIDACDFDVVLDEAHESHDHDMEYLYGNLDGGDEHDHEHGHGHHHHGHGHGHHHHGHGHKHEHDHDHNHEHCHDHDHEHEHCHDHDHEHEHCHDHDHEHEHHHHDHVHAHDHEHPHTHSHGHNHDHDHHHHHEHRSPADIAAIIDAADLAPRAKKTAHRIFDIVATAESKAHGLPLEQVHFHEVGAVDSIVDVVSVAYCLDDLDVTDAYVTPLAEGYGRVRCAHGVLSVPVPAVANIVIDNGLVLERRDIKGELVTPTGAAIAAAVRTMDAPPAQYRVVRAGLGSGKRAYDPPSTVRAFIIEAVDSTPVETKAAPAPAAAAIANEGLGTPDLWKLETEVDDCTGEALGNVTQLLYDAGALEVHYLPVFMKKNRPGYQIELLCNEADIAAIENVLFENTTTIGIRRCPEWRTALPREAAEIDTPLGAVRVKIVTLPSGARRTYPEHDSVAALAAAAGLPYQEALRRVTAAVVEHA